MLKKRIHFLDLEYNSFKIVSKEICTISLDNISPDNVLLSGGHWFKSFYHTPLDQTFSSKGGRESTISFSKPIENFYFS